MLLCESVKRFSKLSSAQLSSVKGARNNAAPPLLMYFLNTSKETYMWIFFLSFFSEYSKSSTLRLMYIHLMGIFLESSSAAVVCAHAGLMARRKSISPACLSPTVILCTLCQTLQRVYRIFLLPDSEKRVLGRPHWTQSSAIWNIWHVLSVPHTHTHMHAHCLWGQFTN